MSKDDFHVILYKVLSYLYECLKAGIAPSIEEARALADVNSAYWGNALQMMCDSGYVTGICRSSYKERKAEEQDWLGTPAITEKGIGHLMENSLMAKAKDLLGDAWPGIVSAAAAFTKNML
jgi:hypothetical protein